MALVSDFLVTIASYWFLSDAMLAQNALEAAGIESVLDDQNMASNYMNAVRGVKLRVRNVDAIRAGEVLEARCEALEEIGEADEEQSPDACPNCGSVEIARKPRMLVFAIVAAILIALGIALNATEAGFFSALAAGLLLLIANNYRCSECEETWN